MSTDQLLAARYVGSGFPILFIHGWQENGNTEMFDFEPIFKSISGYQRIYVDLPGTGLTPSRGVKSQDDIFLRLIHFVDTVISTSRFLLAGSSCGAYLA